MPSVLYEFEDGLATITIDDGKVNVMTAELLGALCGAIDRAAADRAMILLRSGRDRVFSAGFDVKPLMNRDASASRTMVQAGIRAILALLEHPYPVIALCGGHVFPMGAFLLLASDVRIGAEGDYRIGLNEVAIGLAVPDFALELAGYRLAQTWRHRVCALGEMLSPGDAVSAGFLDRLVPPDHLAAAANAVVVQLKGIDMAAHTQTKQAMRERVIRSIRTIAGARQPEHQF
ncbi:enoyl-CoA hydratase [Novosphingobium sediminis]|uniref:Enoyl-CoA hydratase n=1 Tax=Novosphingobium sediminis TaxID=707214 RepID=A0A512AGC9_9SPHN|nr:crotonase/enoyl-CoA hydratase family protein [Novosphingobium sediminis]GEN98692.1 enoyl-CoA hydratase [Novosphingobium sediminis]